MGQATTLTAADVDREHETMRPGGVRPGVVLRWPDLTAVYSFRGVDGNTLYVVEAEGGHS